ncbi:hypothetical protein ED312_00710 [Sinomicrobium pectinilyticum]|uniref:Uncharacterized protein n=1 Tax=Sinomicrobium pectinilyticum TaxID=1084421 RepID=A0A3N0F4V3_SINP1|nr:hypothetical protein ED312_00710 [Sinomicrobium pectinilyticum]
MRVAAIILFSLPKLRCLGNYRLFSLFIYSIREQWDIKKSLIGSGSEDIYKIINSIDLVGLIL